MNDRVRIDSAKGQDAAEIVEIHHAAVHQTAGSFYSDEVLNGWSRPVSNDRITALPAARWMLRVMQRSSILDMGLKLLSTPLISLHLDKKWLV